MGFTKAKENRLTNSLHVIREQTDSRNLQGH